MKKRRKTKAALAGKEVPKRVKIKTRAVVKHRPIKKRAPIKKPAAIKKLVALKTPKPIIKLAPIKQLAPIKKPIPAKKRSTAKRLTSIKTLGKEKSVAAESPPLETAPLNMAPSVIQPHAPGSLPILVELPAESDEAHSEPMIAPPSLDIEPSTSSAPMLVEPAVAPNETISEPMIEASTGLEPVEEQPAEPATISRETSSGPMLVEDLVISETNESEPLIAQASQMVDEPAPMIEPPPAPVEMPPIKPDPQTGTMPWLFEVAWEVCWQLGGIYTVLKTKADMMLRKWGDRYFLVGPFNPQTAAVELEEIPAEGAIAQAMSRLKNQGINCYFGRWMIPGRPKVILIDHHGRYSRLDADKYLLWKDHGISTSNNDGEVNDVTAFGFAVTEFLREIKNAVGDRPILAHFHEWMAGIAVPRLAHERIPVSTVFTTHATLLGRYLANDNPNFYHDLPYLNGDEEAKKYQIYPRFQIERAAAHASTVFTTVSEVTGFEAEKLLGRKPDVILPNGLNIERFAALHEFQNLHLQYKEKIHEFVMGHFFPCYTFDLDNTLYIFTSGRYEYRNKGMDLFIEALYQLNQRMRWMPERPTVVAFIITKAATRNINVGVLHSQSMFEELKGWCGQLTEKIGGRLVHCAAQGRLPTMQDLIDEDERIRLKQGIYAWKSGRQPPIVTHDLVDDANDGILQHLRHRHMFNAADDPVKIIFHPQFVSATSPLLSLDYDQMVRGCHMGVFPSNYEPWGYTPMESIALGVPAVTTDLSGFGAYVRRQISNHDENGIKVLDRRDRSFEEATSALVEHLLRFVMMTRRQRIELRNKVERLGERFDWSALISHYHDAHALALSRTGVATPPGKLEIRMV
jgi:glycogen synthase